MDFVIPRSSITILASSLPRFEFIGHSGIGKRRLASCIRSEITSNTSEGLNAEMESRTNTDVNFRTAEELPLNGSDLLAPVLSILRPLDTTPSNNSSTTGPIESRLRYDLILLMVNMTNLASWELAKQSILKLNPSWLLGRCALIITKGIHPMTIRSKQNKQSTILLPRKISTPKLTIFEVSAVSKYAFDRDDITDFVSQFYNIPVLWTNLDIDSEATLTAQQIIRILGIGAGYRTWSKGSSAVGLPKPLASLEIGATGKEFKSHVESLAQLCKLSQKVYPGLANGSRITTTTSLAKSPEKYYVETTTRH